MTGHEPASMEPMVPGATTPTPWWATTPTPWATARAHLEETTATYWLATVRPNGAPHVMPVLAVWVDGRLFFSAQSALVVAGQAATVFPHADSLLVKIEYDLIISSPNRTTTESGM